MLVAPTRVASGSGSSPVRDEASGLVSSPGSTPASTSTTSPSSVAPTMAKSILKRRATQPDPDPERAHGQSVYFENKRIRFSSTPSPYPLAHEDDAQQSIRPTQLATGGGTWLDEDTRKQMALMGQGSSKKKRKASELGAEELELAGSVSSSLSKLQKFAKESKEWSDMLRPLLGPLPSTAGSASSSRRQSISADYAAAAANSPSGAGLSPGLPPLDEVLNAPSPLHEPSSLPHHPTFPSSLLRRQSAPEALLRSSAAATLASFASNPTTHDRRRPSYISSPSPVHLPHHPPSPLSHSYLLSNSQNSAPSSPHHHPIVDPSLHLPPIRASPVSVPNTPLFVRPAFPSHAASVPASLPTRRTSHFPSKAPDTPSASHLLNQLRRHSTPASPAMPPQTGGAKDLLRRFSTIVKERVESWEGIEDLVRDAEEVRKEWDQGMAMV